MSRPVPNTDPRAPTTNRDETNHERPDTRPRYFVYVTWQAKSPDGRILDYGKVYDARTWHDAQAKARTLERLVREQHWPALDAIDVRVDVLLPGLPDRRSVDCRDEFAALAATLRAVREPADEVF